MKGSGSRCLWSIFLPVALLLCAMGFASACIVQWDTYTNISVGNISSPTDNGVYCVDSEVTCSIGSASDIDHRYDPSQPVGQRDTYPADTFNNSDAYTWSSGGVGSWKNGDYTGQSVVWIAPSTPQSSVTITCTIKDDAVINDNPYVGTRNDTDVQRSVTVTVVKVATVSGPDQCVLCKGVDYSFTLTTDPPNHCDIMEWIAAGGTPNQQQGGCTFTTRFNTSGSGYQVLAGCGAQYVQTPVYEVAEPCSGESAMPEIVVSYRPPEPPLDSCTFGLTSYLPPDEGDYEWEVCFNCATNHWKVIMTRMDVRIVVKYDWHGKLDAEGVYTCAAATDVKTWQDSIGGGFGDACDTTYVPRHCIEVHENTHVEQLTPVIETEAEQTRDLINALYREPQEPYCTLDAAAASLDWQVNTLLADMYLNVAMQLNQERMEQEAYSAELLCVNQMLDDICSHLTEPCEACGTAP